MRREGLEVQRGQGKQGQGYSPGRDGRAEHRAQSTEHCRLEQQDGNKAVRQDTEQGEAGGHGKLSSREGTQRKKVTAGDKGSW